MNKNLNELAEIILEHGQFKFKKLGDYVECSISNQKIVFLKPQLQSIKSKNIRNLTIKKLPLS